MNFRLLIALTLFTAVNAQTLAACQLVPTGTGVPCGTTGTCLNFTVDASTYCACESGWGGDSCQSTVNPADNCQFPNATDLSTDFPPINISASFNNDTFSVSIYSPLVGNRLYTKISIDTNGTGNYNCTYPGPNWQHEIAGCTDLYVGNMPWAPTLNCGWQFDNTSDSSYYDYNATMTIDHYDYLDAFAGRTGGVIRNTQHIVPLLVQFPKSIDVSSTISVNSPVRLLVAVTKQEVDPITKEATIEFATNLLFPYFISTSALTSKPSSTPAMTFNFIEIVDSQNGALCPSATTDVGTTCTQRFRISILTNGNCNITGTYTLQFDLACHPGVDCNLNANAQATVTASIISENFCALVSAKVTITGSLASYNDNTYQNTRTIYLVNQVSYFKVQVSSPQATLTKATISQVKIVNNDTNADLFVLYSGGTSYAGVDFGIGTPADTASTAEFFFTLNASLFNNATNSDVTKNFKVQVKVDVQFQGVPGTKRFVLDDLNTRQVTLGTSVGISSQTQTVATGGNSGSALVFGILSLLIMVIVNWL